MNVYDFDGTIYNGDTNKDLIKYAFKKYPKLVWKSLMSARKLKKEYEHNLVEFERVKEELLSFIFKINNYPQFINEFVDNHMKNIKPWYMSKKTENDVILSASYDLWISQFAKRLGVKVVIATKTDSNGKIVGRNCKGEEKVRRLREILPDVKVKSSYGDSECDKPVLELAETAFVVEGNKLKAYFKGYKFKNKK